MPRKPGFKGLRIAGGLLGPGLLVPGRGLLVETVKRAIGGSFGLLRALELPPCIAASGSRGERVPLGRGGLLRPCC